MTQKRLFKVIIFDIDNTLIYRTPRPVETILAFAQEKGLPIFPDALQRGERRNFAYYAEGQADQERVLLGYHGFRQNYVRALLQAMCPLDDVSAWLDQAVERFATTPREDYCPERVRQVVRALYEAGYHLAAISNRDGDLYPLLDAHQLGEFFAFTLSGGWAGVYKPNPEIFRIAMNTLGVSPAATLAVGDSYDADIVGAQQAGITAVLLDPHGVFPDAQCRTIRQLDELIPWLIQPDSDELG